MDAAALAARHAADVKFLENKVAQLSKPRLGIKPLTAEQVQLQAAKLRQELNVKHDAELAALAQRLASATIDNAPSEAASSGVCNDELRVPGNNTLQNTVVDGGSAALSATVGTGMGALSFSGAEQPPPQQQLQPSGAAATAPATRATESSRIATASSTAPISSASAPTAAPGKQTSRAQRRHQKKTAQRSAGRSDDAAEDEGPAPRDVELAALREQLAPLSLGMRLVAADGNCLFRVRCSSEHTVIVQHATSCACHSRRSSFAFHAGRRRSAPVTSVTCCTCCYARCAGIRASSG